MGLSILFAADVDPDPDSGAAGTEWQTIKALRELGHEVDEIWARDLGRRIRHGNLHYLLELPSRYRTVIDQRCKSKRYDVLHVNQGHCYRAARAHQRSGRSGVFVCRSHGLDDHMDIVLAPWRTQLGLPVPGRLKQVMSGALGAALKRHDRLAYRWSDGVIVSAGHDARYLQQTMGMPEARVATIPQAPARVFVEKPAVALTSVRSKRILHVGGFAYWKGVHAVGAAVSELLRRHVDASMTWVCRDREHDQVRSLLDADVRHRVDLCAWMPQAELRDLYDEHGVFLCPSLFDGFGKVFLEAMSRGLAVVGTRTGGMPDVIRDGVNGLLVEFNAAAEIIERVESLWNDETMMARMSHSAAEEARRYSWRRVAQETAAFYQHLIEMRRAQEVAV